MPRTGPGRVDIIPLPECGGGQHDVGMTRGGGPADVLHDHSLRARPRLAQARQLLMVMERIAADLEELAAVESFPKMEGRQMIMILAPKKK